MVSRRGPGYYLRPEKICRARQARPGRPSQQGAWHRRSFRCHNERQFHAPTGELSRASRGLWPSSRPASFYNARDFEDAIIAWKNGAPVRLREIAVVEDPVQQDKQTNWGNGGVPSITLAIDRQPGANTVQVIDTIREILPGLLRQLPPSVKVGGLL